MPGRGLVDRRLPDGGVVTNALGMAIQTDQGVQFASWAFPKRAKDSGLVPSMGSVGDGYDHSMIEVFWSRGAGRAAGPSPLEDPGRASYLPLKKA